MPKAKLKVAASYADRLYTAAEIEDVTIVDGRKIGENAIIQVSARSVASFFALGLTTASLPVDTKYVKPEAAPAKAEASKPAKK